MDAFEFDTIYKVDPRADVPNYVPHVEHDNERGILIDGSPWRDTEWRALSGYTRQYGYRGPVMHPSETLSDDAILEAVERVSGDVFAIVVVASCGHDTRDGHDNGCDCDVCEESVYCQTYGCPNDPAGWAIIYRYAGHVVPRVF